jgi:hypothetical protein
MGFVATLSQVQCGWLRDKFGVSWQIVPTVPEAMLRRSPGFRANRDRRNTFVRIWRTRPYTIEPETLLSESLLVKATASLGDAERYC